MDAAALTVVEDHHANPHTIDRIEKVFYHRFRNGQLGQVLTPTNRGEVISVITGPKGTVFIVTARIGVAFVMAVIGQGRLGCRTVNPSD
jgi:hypothetical protein